MYRRGSRREYGFRAVVVGTVFIYLSRDGHYRSSFQEGYHNVNIPVGLRASMGHWAHWEPTTGSPRTPPPPHPTTPPHLTGILRVPPGAFVRLLSLRCETPGQSQYWP